MKQPADSALVMKLLDLRTDLLKLIRETVFYDRKSKKMGRAGGQSYRSLVLLKKKLLAAEKEL